MTDIFISYRRKDFYCSRPLYKALEARFATFWDTASIKAGENFPGRITSALQTCQVFIAAIGPQWIKTRNLKRLFKTDDWVRKELLQGLDGQEAGRVSVLPVLLDGAGMPEAARLPEDLRPLAKIQALALSNQKLEQDLQELTDWVAAALTGQSHKIATRTAFPPVLPHLCDRTAQEDGLIDFFEEQTPGHPTPVIILHGHRLEDHFGFLKRVRYKSLLEDIFGVRGEQIGVEVHPLDWDVATDARGKLAKALRRAVNESVLGSKMAPLQKLQQFFKTIRLPQVFVLSVTWDEYQHCGEDMIEKLVRAWQDLFTAEEENGAARKLQPPYHAALWINLSYDDRSRPLVFDDLLSEDCRPVTAWLPAMPAIQEGHIQRWIGLEAVKPHIAGLEGRILSLVEDDDCCHREGRIHMRRFVDRIRGLLA